MSPFARYYTTWAAVWMIIAIIAAIASTVGPRLEFLGPAIFVLVLLLIYGQLVVSCPRCGKLLSQRRTLLTYGITGRRCPQCGQDLTVSN